MPSSYTPSLRLVLPVTGELDGTWGDTVNTGLTELVEDAIAGTADITVGGSNVTLTTANEAADQARNMFLNLTGTPGASRDIVVPAQSKLYFVHNATDAVMTVKTPSGAGIAVPVGMKAALYCNGTSVVVADGTLFGTQLKNVADEAAAQTTLGGTTVGKAVFTAANAATAQTTLGGTTVGKAVFTAADEAAARTAIGTDVYKTLPSAGPNLVTGDVYVATAGFTLNTGLAAGNIYPIYNNSGSVITITQGSGVTLRLAGTTSAGTRTLAARGLASLWCLSTTEYIISGAGVA